MDSSGYTYCRCYTWNFDHESDDVLERPLEPEEVPGAGGGVPGLVLDEVLLDLVGRHRLDGDVVRAGLLAVHVALQGAAMQRDTRWKSVKELISGDGLIQSCKIVINSFTIDRILLYQLLIVIPLGGVKRSMEF